MTRGVDGKGGGALGLVDVREGIEFVLIVGFAVLY